MAIKREYLCDFGDCHNTGSPLPIAISVNLDVPRFKETRRFCSHDHAAQWMQSMQRRLVNLQAIERKYEEMA